MVILQIFTARLQYLWRNKLPAFNKQTILLYPWWWWGDQLDFSFLDKSNILSHSQMTDFRVVKFSQSACFGIQWCHVPVILSTSRLLAAHHSAKIIEKAHFNGYSITHRIWSRQYYCRHLTSYWNFNLKCECLHHRHYQGLGNGATSRTAIAPSFLLKWMQFSPFFLLVDNKDYGNEIGA